MSRNKVNALSNGVFLILLALIIYTNTVWPGILFAIGAALVIRQYFTGRKIDLIITLVILAILFTISFTGLSISTLAPLALVLGGVYIILREYFFAESSDKDEK